MLPLALTLRNFLSYRNDTPTLHLEGVHVACLCGANGHGKSALLDAVTWALWGKARGQRHEQLLHQGQQDMSVELEFEARDQRYRVIRRYSRARRQAASSLELTVVDGSGYRAITGDTISATQHQLERLISMDFETFVNSAFLMQGRANLFSMSRPGERKEVLAKVLGLGLYDRLEERSKAHAREAQSRMEVGGQAMEQMEHGLAHRAEKEHELKQTDATLSSAQQHTSILEERLGLLRNHVESLKRRQEERHILDQQHLRLQARKEEAEEDVTSLETRLDRWRETVTRSADIQQGHQLLLAARKRLVDMQASAQQSYALERELAPLEQTIVAAKTAMENGLKSHEKAVEELLYRVEALPELQHTLTTAEAALARLETKASEVATVARRQQQASLDARRLEEENAHTANLGRETRTKLEMLDRGHAEGVLCPLCGTELETEAHARIEQTYRKEIEAYSTQYREQTERVKMLDQEAVQHQLETTRRQKDLDAERKHLARQRAQSLMEQDEALKAQDQLKEAKSALGQAQDAVAKGNYAPEAQARAEPIRLRIAEAPFDPNALASAAKAARDHEHWEEEHRRLEDANTRMSDDEAALVRASARFQESTLEAQELTALRTKVLEELADLPNYQAQLTEVETEHRSALSAQSKLQEERGALAQQVHALIQAEEELQRRRKEQKALTQESAMYRDLTLAFGKGGVQALLIEAAIPQLEEEANRLLRRMTDGRMSLKFETQRTRRTGPGRDGDAAIETLEILVADELGTRSYEMFSGGESFRVDFAIRVALSKLLAWRAGAPLPTLFLDEGFGTQDADGRDRILDVIKSIEPDFQRILVVTHMDEIKEAFPIRIEVTKTTAGSTFALA